LGTLAPLVGADSQPTEADMSDLRRVERLEEEVRRLSLEVDALRAALRAPAPASRPVSARVDPAAPHSTTSPTAPVEPATRALPRSERFTRSDPVTWRPASLETINLEALIGRYGAMALAALTILLGMGAFLSWAIAHGKLGPEGRVILGALGALALAAFGWRTRARGARRFGDTLISLALAVMHVVAWSAGPSLHVVPAHIALLIADVASIALVALALREGDEFLAVVGVGGSLLAPFVTSEGDANLYFLLGYGLALQIAGLHIVRVRGWRIVASVLAVGCLAYTVVAVNSTARERTQVEALLPAGFALLCAWVALLVPGAALRTRLALVMLSALVVAVFSLDASPGDAAVRIAFAALGTASTYAALGSAGSVGVRSLVGVAVLSGAFFLAAVTTTSTPSSVAQGALALGWAAMSVAAAWVSDEVRRGAYRLLASLFVFAAILLTLEPEPVARIAVLSAYAAILAVLARAAATGWLVPALFLALVAGAGWSHELLAERRPYSYAPFVTAASMAAFANVLAWWVASWQASRLRLEGGEALGSEQRTFLWLLGGAAALFWIRAELMHAYSPDLSTFLLILFYAFTGVLAILIGRWRQLPLARRAGLALAIYAAIKSVVQASGVESIGLRVGSYLLAGLFLLAVAYWYRAAGEEERAGVPSIG
jgi:uncharacterized membrane protein